MQRKLSKTAANATQAAQNKSNFDARVEIAALKERVAKLEARLADELPLEFGFESDVPKTRPGPKTRINLDGIRRDRDLFVSFFETYWPEIEPLCGQKPDIATLRSLLTSYPHAESPQYGEAARMLLERITHIKEFLSTPKYRARYRDDPRNLAGAIAGAPCIGIWRSLKLCPPRTCTAWTHPAAMRSYFKRKHRDVHDRLLASTDLIHVTHWWKEYRTRDERLHGLSAADVIRLWKASASNYVPLSRSD